MAVINASIRDVCSRALCRILGDQALTKYCTVKLTEEKYQAFVYAVKNHYWYQMYIDDLPIWGRYSLCNDLENVNLSVFDI